MQLRQLEEARFQQRVLWRTGILSAWKFGYFCFLAYAARFAAVVLPAEPEMRCKPAYER
jgi:hypothetical protein